MEDGQSRVRVRDGDRRTTMTTAVQAGTASHSVAGLLNPNSTGSATLVNSGSVVARPARSMRALGAPGPSDKNRPAMAGAQPARNARAGASHAGQVCARTSRATRRAGRRDQQESGRNPPHLLRVRDGDGTPNGVTANPRPRNAMRPSPT